MSFLSLSLSIPIPLLGHHHPPPLSQPAGGAPHPSSGSPCSSTSGFYSKTFGLLGETGPDKQTYMVLFQPVSHDDIFFILIVSVGGSSLHQLGNTTRRFFHWIDIFPEGPRLFSRKMKHCEKEVSERVANSRTFPEDPCWFLKRQSMIGLTLKLIEFCKRPWRMRSVKILNIGKRGTGVIFKATDHGYWPSSLLKGVQNQPIFNKTIWIYSAKMKHQLTQLLTSQIFRWEISPKLGLCCDLFQQIQIPTRRHIDECSKKYK